MTDVAVKALGRDVLGRGNARRKHIVVEEWGGSVLIRQLSSRQVSEIQQLATEAVDSAKRQVRDRKKLTRFNFCLIRDSWISEDGTPVLTDDDYESLLDEPNAAIETLTTEISAFNNLGERAQADAKKNLEPTLNGNSGIN